MSGNLGTNIRTKLNITGEELFQRYLLGDERAFEEMIALYEEDLSRFINSKINDFYETKYLVIETFGQLAVNGKNFSGKSSLKTYIFTIARNLVNKHLKERAKNNHISFDDIVETAVEDHDSPDIYMEHEETRQRLRGAMKLLSDDYNRVLTLLYFDDMSYLQAANAMKKSEKQIKNLAHRAKESLKKLLVDI